MFPDCLLLSYFYIYKAKYESFVQSPDKIPDHYLILAEPTKQKHFVIRGPRILLSIRIADVSTHIVAKNISK